MTEQRAVGARKVMLGPGKHSKANWWECVLNPEDQGKAIQGDLAEPQLTGTPEQATLNS